MNRAHYIAGDWSTSRLRLSLCLDDRVVETRQGPGIGVLREPAAAALRPLVAGWRDTRGPLPVVLCGMAGSREYLPCPAAGLRALGGAATRFETEGAQVAIAPGLSYTRRLGALIGDGALNGRHTQALRREGIPASCLDGEHCALAGLRTLWQP